jgi:hypothetical protein
MIITFVLCWVPVPFCMQSDASEHMTELEMEGFIVYFSLKKINFDELTLRKKNWSMNAA